MEKVHLPALIAGHNPSQFGIGSRGGDLFVTLKSGD
jgi:hypothetical protein